MEILAFYEALVGRLKSAIEEHYGDRLVSIVIFGSVGRRTPRPDSDVDILIVARGLPKGRIPRVRDFDAVEQALEPYMEMAREEGFNPYLSPIFKTPEEVLQGSLLFLDMVHDAQVLYDSVGFMRNVLGNLQRRLRDLGARRVWLGNAWYWDLKPGYRPGEVFDL